MFDTAIAGSLPKPAWLAEPQKLWPQWKQSGAELAQAKLDATLLWIKAQEDAGLDVIGDGEQSRQHFVHGFLEKVAGIDFEHKVEMGIRNDRYKAMVPQVVAPLRLNGRVHRAEAQLLRAHTRRKIKFTLPGPMTIVDTVADRHYGDRVKLGDIQPDHWLPEYTTELINLLNVLGLLVELEPTQAELLDKVCSGPLIPADELSAAGALELPQPKPKKKAKKKKTGPGLFDAPAKVHAH